MELKDAILSTLAEMEDNETTKKVLNSSIKPKKIENTKIHTGLKQPSISLNIENEVQFLNSLKERLLVLFDGFQAPNNANIESKIDMTLNFLEYALATIETRVRELEKGSNN
ncbi:MAG: hypothetical protein GXO30_03360 [Epsilonproteobacteria bacterium]|nr:hypothetical protein [Campylobacterota bacterium]